MSISAKFEEGKLGLRCKGKVFEIPNDKEQALAILLSLRQDLENTERLTKLYEIMGQEISDIEKIEELIQSVQSWDSSVQKEQTVANIATSSSSKDYEVPPPCIPSMDGARKNIVTFQSDDHNICVFVNGDKCFPVLEDEEYDNFLSYWDQPEIFSQRGLRPAFNLRHKKIGMVGINGDIIKEDYKFSRYEFWLHGKFYANLVFQQPKNKGCGRVHFLGVQYLPELQVIPTRDFESYGLLCEGNAYCHFFWIKCL